MNRLLIAILLVALVVLPPLALLRAQRSFAAAPPESPADATKAPQTADPEAQKPEAPKPETQKPEAPTPASATDSKSTDTAKEPMHKYSRSGFDVTPYSRAKVAELAKKLDPEAYRITQNAGTEPAFCGTLLDNKKNGTYCCVVCGLPLFASDHKFNSGTGWPSFFRPFDVDHVAAHEDNSHGMQRVEINCARCNAHLGHVFDDGPRPTGLRFCLNGAALVFHEKGEQLPPESQPVATETAYFAGGCFWGIEHYFQLAPGVISAESGYMQGSSDSPKYREVCEQDDVPASQRPAGYKPHVEAVKVVFDPKAITYRQLLEGFFEMHDPTQLNRQGPDYGTQYRSGVYTTSDAQAAAAKAFVAELSTKSLFGARKVVTEIEPAKTFFAAEDYHQDYLEKNPDRGCHIGKPWWLAKPAAATK
jgi:peptide methionine sulfoxide reductase msrA/msrB